MKDGIQLDLHVHSRHSPDSRLSLEEIVAGIQEAGLDGFALTDHNTVAGHAALARLAEENPRLTLVPGLEVSTADGHLLALGVAEVPPLHRGVAETCAWVSAHGGVPVPSHPFRWVHGIGRRLASEVPVPALETLNGHNGEIANDRAELLAARRGLGGTGGSDAHDRRDLGRAFTEFPAEVRSVAEVLEALRHHRSRGDGRSTVLADRLRRAWRNSLLRAGRGFRAI